MTLPVVFRRAARSEFDDAALWYEERCEGLGAQIVAEIVDDLDHLQEIELNVDGKAYRLRTEAKGTVGKVFQACGVALPPTVRSAR